MLGQLVGLGILTLLMHPGSIFSLSPTVLRQLDRLPDPLYWAQLITIAIVTPLSFVLNKLWTFSAVRGKNSVAGSAVEELDTRARRPSDTPAGHALRLARGRRHRPPAPRLQ